MKYTLRYTGEFKRSLKRCLKRGYIGMFYETQTWKRKK